MSKYVIELYGLNGEPLGYVESISVRNMRVESTANRFFAKTYAKIETANKDVKKVDSISKGCLRCVINE